MKLEAVDIKSSRALSREVKALYLSAFPKAERVPWWVLRRVSQVTAYCEEGTLRGFTSSVQVPGLYFVAFFAIPQSCRGMGYGSRILQELREKHGAVALNVEPLDEVCTNRQERENRLAFYKKNGFADTGWDVWEVGGRFWILSTEALDVKAYQKVFSKVSGGLWKVKIKKRPQ